MQYINRTIFGVHHSYRNANMQTHYQRNIVREGKLSWINLELVTY